MSTYKIFTSRTVDNGVSWDSRTASHRPSKLTHEVQIGWGFTDPIHEDEIKLELWAAPLDGKLFLKREK